jgi:uncharacterized PurR-regulated membrane protein YhhQ (DUF165 family)
MSTTSHDDRWLLPRRQTEYPARDLLPEEMLHGRREATFLTLAAIFLVTTAALLVLGTSRIIEIDPSVLLARIAPGVELRFALLLPLGVIPFSASFIASALVCELLGRRRANVLVWIGLLASMVLVGLMRVADLVDGGDAFGVSLALAACYVIAHVTNLVVFDRLRPRRPARRRVFLRATAAAFVAQALGWATFGAVLLGGRGYIVATIAPDTIVGISVAAAVCSLACVIVLAMPGALIAHGLALALRVGRDLFSDDEDEVPWARAQPAFAEGSVARKLRPALIVDEGEATPANLREAPPMRAAQAYSSAEMRFFSEGDAVPD